MTSAADPHVMVVRQGGLGHITLNRPAKINALTVDMIDTVRGALKGFAGDARVGAVLIDGAGDRGLCSGGDIAVVYHGLRGDAASPQAFWGDEYRMNLEISRYPKPLVALMDGIVMGGGLGISGHASVRVVTQTSQVAMPETGIGLSPDVGGLYLLARSPGEFGTRAALIGARLGPGDAIAARLADHFVPRDRLPTLTDRLVAALAPASGGDAAGRVTDGIGQTPDATGLVLGAVTSVCTSPPPGDWPGSGPWIDACYAGDDAREILRRLRGHAEPAARRDADVLAAMSPTAVAVTLRAIRNAASMPLSEVLEQDLLLCTRFMAHPDFAEGIRAQIIDKDRRPRWRPASLDDVTTADVDAFFVPLPG